MSSQNTESGRNNILNEWNNLTIANRFIFAKVMTDRDLCTELIRSILPDLPVDHIEYVEYEKDVEADIDSKSVRLDVYTKDEEGRAFDLEMQIAYYDYLPRRSRYYGIMLDETLLQRGFHYPNLNDSYVIFICPFDMFGQKRYIYHFANLCLEDPGLPLGDGQYKIFLNAQGETGDISENLRAFLKLVSGGGPENAFADRIQSAVRKARHNSVWRREYMIWRADMDLELEIERNKAIKEGLAEGRAKGLAEGKAKGLAEGKAKGLAEGKAKGLAEGKAEGKAEGLAEGKAEGLAEGRKKGLAEGREKERAKNISELLEKGVSIEILYEIFGEKDVDTIRDQSMG